MNIKSLFADSVPPVSGGIPYLSDDDSNIFLFHVGIPNSKTFPTELMMTALGRSTTPWNEVLQYSPVVGDLCAREGLIKLYSHRGESAAIEELMITAGIAESFDLLPELFINPGDVIFTEDPSYPWGIRSFKIHRANVVPILTDLEGMDPEHLEKAIRAAGKKAKMIYTMPIFHNPMGIVTSWERRKAIVELADKYNLIVIEDDPYRELSFDFKAPPSLRGEYPHRVINLGTFSKTIGGGIRIGWIWADKKIIEQLTQIKHTGTTTLTAHAAGQILQRNEFYQHLEFCRTHYRLRRDICKEALTANGFEPWMKYDSPGGFYYWLRIPDKIDLSTFYKKLFDNGIYVLPGKHFSGNPELQRFFRLSYSYENKEKLTRGIIKMSALAK